MSLPLQVPNTVQVRLLWSHANQGAFNILHAIVPAGLVVNQALADTLGSAIKSAFSSGPGTTYMGANTILVKVGVRDIRQVAQAEFLDAGVAVPGAGTGDQLPGNVAQCVTLRTAQSGKSFRGRVYLGGWNEAANDASGFQSVAAATAGTNFVAAIRTAMTASQLTMAVCTRPTERILLEETTFHADGTTTVRKVSETKAKAGASSAVTLLQSRSGLWESQRRRVNGRGPAPAAAFATLITA